MSVTLDYHVRVADDFANRLRAAVQTVCARRPEVKQWAVESTTGTRDHRGIVTTLRIVAPDGEAAGEVVIGMKNKTVDIVGRKSEEEKILFGDPDLPNPPVGILNHASRPAPVRVARVSFRPSWDQRSR